MEETLLVYMTAPDRETALALCETLVRERLAAGATVLDGASSCYWWQGGMRRRGESVCLLQSPARCFAALEKRVLELHPYEVPCIVALPLTQGHMPFLRWTAEETQEPDESRRT